MNDPGVQVMSRWRPSKAKLRPLRIKKEASNKLCVQNKTAGANHINSLASAFGVYLLENPVNVVPHRKFRKIEARGDFLVRETLGDQ